MAVKKKIIFIADDDVNICKLIKAHIANDGYEVMSFENGEALFNAVLEYPCDMIISDIMMPKMDGYEVCRRVRMLDDKRSELPFIMISANNEEMDRVLGLQIGGDDYISKPISFLELSIKIKNIFRRTEKQDNNNGDGDILACKDLTLNKKQRICYIDDIVLETTTKEFDLLVYFIQNKNIAVSRDQILEKVWDYDFDGGTRLVDNMITRLRKKMMVAKASCEIETVWGFGYKMTE